MKKGSITVFLSLILVLLFSFLLTTLEAARIRGATAYVSMLTELAGESFLGRYYYPLFQNYRLFGVNAGDEDGFFSEERIKNSLEENLSCGLEELQGGLLGFQNTGVEQLMYKTILTDGDKEFLSQIRQQTVLDGLSLALDHLFSKETFEEAGAAMEVYQKQEEALEVTATVTKELIKLMELVDGVRMKDNGIAFDKYGKVMTKNAFIKQLAPMEQGEIKAVYGNAQIFRAVSDKFYRPDRAAGRILLLLGELGLLDTKITECERRITGYQSRLEGLNAQLKAEEPPEGQELEQLQKEIAALALSIEQETKQLKEYKEQRKALALNAEGEYNVLEGKLKGVQSLLTKALPIVDRLEKKQEAAKITVKEYSSFLEGISHQLSDELKQVFSKELEKMKLYAGLEEKGFSAVIMRRSLEKNLELMNAFQLSGFSEERLGKIAEEMSLIKKRMKEYTVEGLCFTYGEIVVAEQTWENVTDALNELLATGILELVGIPEAKQSDCRLTGTELPSDGLEKESIVEEWKACIEKVQCLFQNGGIGAVLESAGNVLLDSVVMELYSMNYFHSYGEEDSRTKLKYEREYLVFGAEKDTSNLLSMVLYLVAIRTLLCMVMLLKQPDNMARLDAIAAGVVGFTGIPVLAAVVKYTVLMLWSVEEALVEVAALLQGKRIAVVGMGTVKFEELFFINKSVIARKAKQIPDGTGASYQDYLALLSLTKGTREKVYRAMDLIQENIRYRYNDSFRIRNVVTELSFCVKTEAEALFDTGFFPGNVYELKCREERAY